MASNIATTLLKHKVPPDYPQEAHDRRIQGTVRLFIIVGTDGKVTQAAVISGPPLLAESALNAIRKWEYKPVLLNGESVEVETTADVVFSLKH